MSRMFKIAVAAALWASFGLAAAGAAEPDINSSRFSIRAGGFLTALDTSARFGLDASDVYLDLEDMFGLDSSIWSFQANAVVRLGESRRHRIGLTYQGFFRNASYSLPEGLGIGDEMLAEDTIVKTNFDLQVIKLVYSWSFYMDDRFDLGIGGGIYVMPVDLSIAYDDRTLEDEEFYAPLPVLDLHLDFAISSRWYLRQRYSLFYLVAGSYKGDIIDLALNVEYRAFSRTGVGLGFNSFKLAVEDSGIDGDVIDFDGRITTAYTGLELYVVFDL